MAGDIKISADSDAGTLAGTEIVPVLSSGVNATTTTAKIKTLAIGAGSVSVASGKTLTASNSITLAGTDSTTMTLPPASASLGYIGVPQNSNSANYTTVLADAGKHIFHPSADTTARDFTIDGSVSYPVGTVIGFINQHSGGVVTIKITTDAMRLAGAGTTGDRTLAADGIATAIKVASGQWMISGTGLT